MPPRINFRLPQRDYLIAHSTTRPRRTLAHQRLMANALTDIARPATLKNQGYSSQPRIERGIFQGNQETSVTYQITAHHPREAADIAARHETTLMQRFKMIGRPSDRQDSVFVVGLQPHRNYKDMTREPFIDSHVLSIKKGGVWEQTFRKTTRLDPHGPPPYAGTLITEGQRKRRPLFWLVGEEEMGGPWTMQ